MPKQQDKDFSEKEIERRMDKALKSALSMPHKPHEKPKRRAKVKPQRISKRVIPL